MRRISTAYEAEEGWPRRARAGLAALLEALAEEPELARLALLEVGAAGPAAQRRHRAALQRLTPFFDEGRDFAPGGRALPANTSRMAIGAVTGLIADELAADRAAQTARFAFRGPFCHAGGIYRPSGGSQGGGRDK